MEIELRPDQEAACRVAQQSPELYFCDDLLGYGWCFRKGNHLNVGLGRVDPQQLPQRVNDFYAWLKQQGRLPDDLPSKFPGHAYLTYDQAARPLAAAGVLWIGDAAGLAYAESGEGIRPAVQSGLMAAETILAARGDYRLETLDAYRRRMEAHFGPRPPRVPPPRVTSGLRRRLAHWLLRQRWFVRRVRAGSLVPAKVARNGSRGIRKPLPRMFRLMPNEIHDSPLPVMFRQGEVVIAEHLSRPGRQLIVNDDSRQF